MRNWKKWTNWINWRVVSYALAPLPLLSYMAPNLSLNLLEAWLPYMLLAYLLLTVFAALKGKMKLTIWLMAWCIPPASLLYPYMKNQGEPAVMYSHSPKLRIAQINLLQFNRHTKNLVESIRRTEADVIAFQEVDGVWACQLETALSDTYPYQLSVPQNNCYGMAMYSKVPINKWKVYEWEGYPAIAATTRHQGTDTLILSLHAASPVSHGRYAARNRQLQQAGELLAGQNQPTILLGDFNTVPWDKPLRELKQKSKLKDSRLGYQATWPTWLGRYGIPIDYVLHSREWQVVASQTQYLPGSDHRAMVTDLQLNSCAL
jgi:endonuclease/exonuclease/phosphatase (EEP) superfamily protein YafD